ncbi:MAG TPA: NAD(P)-dependent oxidoreductase [Clostridiaceae bacterium]|nr:NAD(P)-dependent oxidoreductase [Clostridiaceae bacterium]
MTKIAWIGTGVMGVPMASHLAEAGHELHLYNRTKAKAEAATKLVKNSKAYSSLSEAIKDCEIIMTMVGYPSDVEEIYLSPGGIFSLAPEGTIAIDFTTSSPELAVKLYREGKSRGISVLDAPVSGGDAGAKKGTLVVMVGGDADTFARTKPLLETFSTTLCLMGGAGYGQHTKAANQVAVAGNTAAMTEALTYAQKVGLDPVKMLDVITKGAAGSWQLENMAPRVLDGDFAPAFFIKHFLKDIGIIEREMANRDTKLITVHAVKEMYEKMVELGFEDDGTQALIKLYKSKEKQ